MTWKYSKRPCCRGLHPRRALCFEPLETRRVLDSTVVFNEIMYHLDANEDALEWVEFYNQLSVDMDVSSWRIAGGIDYEFAEGTIVPGRGYLVVAIDPVALEAASGYSDALGPFEGRLSNDGEELLLLNNNGRRMNRIDYSDEDEWPVGPDGSGVSLAKRNENLGSEQAENWTYSGQIGGSPGSVNFAGPTVLPPVIEGLVSEGDTARVLIPTQPGDLTQGQNVWNEIAYNDSVAPAWFDATTGIGFDATGTSGVAPLIHPTGDIQAQMFGQNASALSRFEFEVTAPDDLDQLALTLNYNDGYVAYLNGTEVARRNAPTGTPGFDTSAVAPPPAGYSTQVLADNPVGYWRFEESDVSAGRSAADTANAIQGDNPGVYVGGTAAIAGAISTEPSQAILINNTNLDTANDYVRIADTFTGGALAATSFTFEAWINPISSGAPGCCGNFLVRGFFADGSATFAQQRNGGNINAGINAEMPANAAAIPANQWAHVVVTFDAESVPGNTIQTIYFNGDVAPSFGTPDGGGNGNNPFTRPGIAHNDTGAEFVIGALAFGSSADPFGSVIQAFHGGIDEVAYYDYLLPQGRIAAHFDAATGGGGGLAEVGTDIINLDDQTDLLVTGTNVLAIHGLNLASTDDDFLIRPDLKASHPSVVVDPSMPPGLVINEVASGLDAQFRVEIGNISEAAIDLDGFVLKATGATGGEYVFGPQLILAGGLIDVSQTELGFDPASGEKLFLYAPGKNVLADAREVTDRLRGRSAEHNGRWLNPDVPTPGTPNTFHFNDDVVINEIMFHHRGTQEVPAEVERIPLVSIDSVWRYEQSRSDLGTAWRETAYNDASWPTGAGLLDAEPFIFLPAPRNTHLQLGATTYYFRRQFWWDGDAFDELRLRPILDDGAVFYLNGVEIHRVNMPDGPVSHGTLASVQVNDARWFGPVTIPSSVLLPGSNVLAVEVHQQTSQSSDVAFGAELYTSKTLAPGMAFQESTEEWIELVNRGTAPADLTGWTIRDAIDFDFAAGTTIDPGQYLVVSNDAASLAAIYPSIDIVGDYSRQLSNSNDRILLRDASNNPADEVHYYDGGRWPEFADAGGSSLELRDPDADNSHAEAWAGSDETDKSNWNSYSFRQHASGGTGPNIWNEFWMGLLDSGEVLVDDIQLVEDPDGAATNLIQNGTFETDVIGSSPSSWRITGTQQGTVVEDPDLQGNQVLHFVASGTMAQLNNHAETTTVGNAPILNETEYEISFRAKWLRGSNQLNTRLVSNRVASTQGLQVPTLNGTPGAANSTVETNIGPTYIEFRHTPVLPQAGESVSITVAAADPDGVASMIVWWSTNSGAWQSAPMTLGSGGVHAGTIPGQSARAIVQFYVEGQDLLGTTSTYPADGRDSRALFQVNEGARTSFAIDTIRLIMTPADNSNMLVNTNTFNNNLIGSTIIYNNSEVFYDVGARLKGSVSSRPFVPGSFRVRLHPDHRLRDVHDSISIDRIKPEEMVVKQMFNHLGGPVSIYDDLAFSVSAPYTGIITLQLARYDDVWADETYAGGGGGTLFEYEVVYNQTDTTGGVEGLKRAAGFTFNNGDIGDLGDRKENYRWQFQIKNHRERDDYSRLVEMNKAFSLTGDELDAATQAVIDVDQWMQAFAMISLSGNADVYSFGFGPHNVHFFVRPEDQKILIMPHDQEGAYALSTSHELYGSDYNSAKVIELPANERLYYGHLQDIINTTFNSSYMTRWVNHYGGLIGQNYGSILSYIQNRSGFVTNKLNAVAPPVPFQITTNGGQDFSVAAPTVSLAGTGWINVREIRLTGGGAPLDLTWKVGDGAVYAETWQTDLPLVPGSHSYTLEAYDFQGHLIGSDAINITTSIDSPLVDALRIAEIQYHPAAPSAQEIGAAHNDQDDFEYLELVNISDQPVNLTEARLARIAVGPDLEGVDFDFSTGAIMSLMPGERLLVVENLAAFEFRHGTGFPLAGQWSGGLGNAGEMITLLTGPTVIQQFSYDDSWHPSTDGDGFSLETINANNPDLGIWGQQAGWQPSGVIGGTPGSVLGDFSLDFQIDGTDIDILFAEIHAMTHNAGMDLNQDMVVDRLDVDELVEQLLGTSYGDADLDGSVDSIDFGTWSANRFMSGLGWASGDFTGDGKVDIRDFNLWNENKFQANVAANANLISGSPRTPQAAGTAGWQDGMTFVPIFDRPFSADFAGEIKPGAIQLRQNRHVADVAKVAIANKLENLPIAVDHVFSIIADEYGLSHNSETGCPPGRFVRASHLLASFWSSEYESLDFGFASSFVL